MVSQRLIRVLAQSILVMFVLMALAVSPAGLQQAQAVPLVPAPTPASIAYVYYGAAGTANEFKTFIEALPSPGYVVTTVPLADVSTTIFSSYQMIIIADDSGDLNNWGAGSAADMVAQVLRIKSPNVPILGLGEGGYAFFGKLGLEIGWPHGWHGPQDSVSRNVLSSILFPGSADPLALYTSPVNTVGIYLPGAPAVTAFGLEPDALDHSDQVLEGCRFLWGSSGSPAGFTADGVAAFENVLNYVATYQCNPVPADLPTDQLAKCLNLVKTADPAGIVTPGDVIRYTLTYTLNPSACASQGLPNNGILRDSIPFDTTYVPNSATDGISPSPSGELEWAVGEAVGTQVKEFKVVVSENQCIDQRMVNNTASLKVDGYLEITSTVSNAVDCPSIALPNNSTFYAEEEILVSPYPLVAGVPSQVSVRLVNTGTLAETLTVDFQQAPLGIGQIYTTFDTQTATIPPGGTILLNATYLPGVSGQASFQILLSGNPPRFTQSNLDVSENFVPGTPDTLVVNVRNNTGSTQTINLVVDNTCPGWTAIVNPASLTSLANGVSQNVTLTVTPPVGPALGSACHIDLQAWAGDTLIGGVRKLDVPPVHLPVRVIPPWAEPEITFTPDPPVLGSAGTICVQLTNPLGVAKNVSVDFSEADFGAGIGFTPIGTRDITLPPNSTDRYCMAWTPSVTGTLHRCLMVTLRQEGFLDMHSQRNIDVVRGVPAGLGSFDYQFRIANPDAIAHKLSFHITPVGLDPYWHPVITLNPIGDPPPASIGPSASLTLHLQFSNLALTRVMANAPMAVFGFGAATQVEVGVLLDGRQIGGFTVQLLRPFVFLPAMMK